MAHLHAVTPGELASQPVCRRRMTVAQAAEQGTHRDLLVAMRTRIARTVASSDCPPRDLAALSRRLQEMAPEIEAIDHRVAEEKREAHVTDQAFDPAVDL